MKKLSLIIATVLFSFGVASADDTESDQHQVTVGVETHALVDIESGGDLNFSLSPAAPTEAGEGLDFTNVTNSELWLNYSSIVSSTGAKNKINVKISEDLPTGLKLQLTVAAPASGGEGTIGSSTATEGSEKTLSTTDEQVVHNIGSGYTGDGSGKGCQLTYSLIRDGSESVNYEDIVAGSKDITVTYTITSQTGGGD